jgi:hypothetical protein
MTVGASHESRNLGAEFALACYAPRYRSLGFPAPAASYYPLGDVYRNPTIL